MEVALRFILLVLIAVQVALGIRFEITSPFQGAGWQAGQVNEFTYKALPDDKNAGPGQKGDEFSAVLLRRATDNPEFVMFLAKKVDISKNTMSVKVPWLAPAQDYFIAIGRGKVWYYSGRFEVDNRSTKVDEQINRQDTDYFYGIYDVYNPNREASNRKRAGTATTNSSSSVTDDKRGTLLPDSGASALGVAGTAIVGLTLTSTVFLAWY